MQPKDQIVQVGDSVTLTVAANTRRARFDQTDAAGLSVQWQKDGQKLDRQTQTTLTIAHADATAAGEYVAVISNLAGRTESTPAELTVAGSVDAAPTITQQPQDHTVPEGQTATFTVAANGTDLSYQWQRNGVDIPGETTTSYTTSPAQDSNDGFAYRVRVTSGGVSVLSRTASLFVQSSPTGTCGDANEPRPYGFA